MTCGCKKALRLAAGAVFALAFGVSAATFEIDCAEIGVEVETPAALSVGDFLALKMPGGAEFLLKVVAVPPAGIAGQSYIARDTKSQASSVVKPTKDGLHVTIDDFEHEKIYSVRVRNGVVEASVHDASGGDGDVCGTCGGDIAAPSATARTTRLKSAARSAGNAFPLAEQKKVVDILVAFDQGAKTRCAALGFDGIDDFADYAVNKMNTVLEMSQLDDLFSYRLVGVVEIDGSWREINGALLGSLRTREGGFSKFSQLREKCGADTITLLIDRTVGSTTGIAYGYYGDYDVPSKFDNQDYACNVCDINTVYSRYTMSHETGHNMGCGHSNRQGNKSGPGRYSDSCGYHFTDTNGVRRGTVMAYTYASGDDYYYDPVPYFSTPEISPAEYGCALGVEGVNDNRRTLTLTYADIAGLREHVVPYDWDVRVFEGERELEDGDYCEYDNYGNHTLTLTHANSDAVVYYTLDGSDPNVLSEHILSGGTISVNLEEDKTLKVCAVIGNEAQSVRTLTLREGIAWSGESGQSGNGRWSDDQNILSWCNGERPFEKWATVVFPDNAQNASISVAVIGEIFPWSAAFTAINTAYTFNRNDAESLLVFRDAAFSPSGDLTFNVPVQMSATSFTTPAGSIVAFNAPFGQVLESSSGYCTNSIVVGNHGTLVVAPGVGNTQTFDSFNNTGKYYSTATLQIGEGTVVFNGVINKGKGLFGSTKIAVGDGGNLVFDVAGATGYDISSPLTVAKGGTVTFNQMEHLRRKLYLDGGTINCTTRFDFVGNPGVQVADDSSMVGGGYLLIRNSDAAIDVSDGKVLALNVGTQTDGRSDTVGKGLVKIGGGEIAANQLLQHSGSTVISNGMFTVGYSSSATYGTGWLVATGATLKVKSGCCLAVPTLTLESGATLALPASASAPLTATNEVSLAGVRLLLDGADDLTEGKSYPLLSSTGGLTGVSDAVVDALPALSYGLEWEVYENGGTLSAIVVAAQLPTTLEIAKGEVVRLADVPAHIEKIVGEGTLVCSGALPDVGYGFTSDEWRGVVSFKNLDNETFTRDFQCELYGNASSKVMFSGCRIQFLKGNGATFAGTLVLDGDAAFSTANGYSNSYNVFGAIEGSGSMSFTGAPQQAYVFEVATNFTGSIAVGAGKDSGAGYAIRGRRIVFGAISSSADLPPRETKSASITIRPGAVASIGPGATWYAYHGVEISGTLLVKGAGAVLDCDADGAMGVSLLDGAKLRFDAADANLALKGHMAAGSSGNVVVEFVPGVVPTNGQRLVEWSASGTVPANRFALSGSLAAGWALAKEQDALRVYKMPDAGENVFAVPSSGVRFEPDMDIVSWMGGYFDGIDLQEFLEEDGDNGLPRYLSYALGIDADYDTTVKAGIEFVDGKVVITPSIGAPEIPGVVLVTTLYGADELSGSLPPVNVFRGRSFAIDPFDDATKGFYKMEVTIDAQ